MKISIIILLLITNYIKGNNIVPKKIDSTIITGKIINVSKRKKHKNINLVINHLDNQETIYGKINDNGKFKFKFNLSFTQDIFIEYKDNLYRIIVHPSDSIYVVYDASNIDYPIRFEGDRAETNNQLSLFCKMFLKEYEYIDFNKIEPLKYKSILYKKQVKYDSIYYSFKNKISPNKEVDNWVRFFLRYNIAFQLTLVKWNKKDKIPNEYWDYTEKYPLNNFEALYCTEYYTYVREYYYAYINSHDRKKKALYAFNKKDYYSYLEILLETIKKRFTGISQDIVLYSEINYILGIDYLIVDSFLKNNEYIFENKLIKGILETQIKNLDSINLKENIIINKDENIINYLVNTKYKNKVIYIDLWAVWCGACINELGYSKELYNEFKDKDVVFIYLCSKSDKAIWKKLLRDKKLEGEHILITDKQADYIYSNFKVQGIPWYILINKEGEIINNAPRPSSNEIKNKLKVLLNK